MATKVGPKNMFLYLFPESNWAPDPIRHYLSLLPDSFNLRQVKMYPKRKSDVEFWGAERGKVAQ